MSDLVGDPEDRFSRVEAQLKFRFKGSQRDNEVINDAAIAIYNK